MKTGHRLALLGAICCAALPLASQQKPAQKIITISSEPHHRLIFHNDYVRVFQVKAEPGQSVLLHRHEVDAISIMNGDADTVVHSPGKPDVQSHLMDAQVRLQPAGYVHSTEIVGTTPYRNITVELLKPQTNEQNLCSQVIAAAPLHCPPAPPDERRAAVPQFRTDQTTVTIVRIPPMRQLTVAESAAPQLIVALDDQPVGVKAGVDIRQSKLLKVLQHRGDVIWLDKEGPERTLSNPGGKEVWLVIIEMKP